MHPLAFLLIICLLLFTASIPSSHGTHVPLPEREKKPARLDCKHLNLNLPPDSKQKKRLVRARLRLPPSWKKIKHHRIQRKLTRKAYRIGVLAKIAYWDFVNDENVASHTQFGLSDDPSPPTSLRPRPVVSGQKRFRWWSRNKIQKNMKNNSKGRNLEDTDRSAQERKKLMIISPKRVIAEIVSRLQMILCRTKHDLRYLFLLLRYYIQMSSHHQHYNYLYVRERRRNKTKTNAQTSNGNAPLRPSHPSSTQICHRKLLDRHETGKRYQIEWTLQNWHEPSPKTSRIKWHDTDLIIATSGQEEEVAAAEIVLSFAGTASTADQFTNVQTLEPVSHSGIYANGANEHLDENIEGSIHRGFLNAYSRVVKGNIQRLCESDDNNQGGNHTVEDSHLYEGPRKESKMGKGQKQKCKPSLTKSLHRRYNACIAAQKAPVVKKDAGGALEVLEESRDNADREVIHAISRKEKIDDNDDDNITNASVSTLWDQCKKSQNEKVKGGNKNKKRKKGKKRNKSSEGCQSQDEKLMDIVREIVIDALHSGQSVYLTGHSQGGAISTMLALDIILNFPEVPISKLHLWTFGAPEVADSTFYQSASDASPRFRAFLQDRDRYHRFVTRAHDCGTDFVTTLVSKGLNRRTARRLGGVRGDIMHGMEADYVPLLKDSSGIEGHFMKNYLKGISFQSPDHPLTTDFNSVMSQWLGEVKLD